MRDGTGDTRSGGATLRMSYGGKLFEFPPNHEPHETALACGRAALKLTPEAPFHRSRLNGDQLIAVNAPRPVQSLQLAFSEDKKCSQYRAILLKL